MELLTMAITKLVDRFDLMAARNESHHMAAMTTPFKTMGDEKQEERAEKRTNTKDDEMEEAISVAEEQHVETTRDTSD